MTEAEQDRAHELLYSCDSREELCGRIAELEGLVRDAVARLRWMNMASNELERRVRALGLEKE